jgi:hypothetical protein
LAYELRDWCKNCDCSKQHDEKCGVNSRDPKKRKIGEPGSKSARRDEVSAQREEAGNSPDPHMLPTKERLVLWGEPDDEVRMCEKHRRSKHEANKVQTIFFRVEWLPKVRELRSFCRGLAANFMLV